MAAARKCLSTDDEFRQAVAESLSVRQVLSCIGLVPAGGNYKTVHTRTQQLGLDTSHFTGAAWNVGVRYKKLSDAKLRWKKYWLKTLRMPLHMGYAAELLKEGWKQHKCEHCGLAEWCEQPIPLELHHLNGVNNDQRISNLQLLCPNCHAQTKN